MGVVVNDRFPPLLLFPLVEELKRIVDPSEHTEEAGDISVCIAKKIIIKETRCLDE